MHYQLQLFSVDQYTDYRNIPIYDPTWSTEIVLEEVSIRTIEAIPEQKKPLQWIEEYSPSNRKNCRYYRYCCKLNNRIFHKHIPGGNIKSAIAIYRKEDIQQEILVGSDPIEILAMIATYSISTQRRN